MKVTQDDDFAGGKYTQIELPSGKVVQVWEEDITHEHESGPIYVYASMDALQDGSPAEKVIFLD